MSLHQIGFFSNLTVAFISIVQAYYRGVNLIPVRPEGRKVVIIRASGGILYAFLFTYFSIVIPASIFTVFINTAVIFSVFLAPLIGEQFDFKSLGLACFALLGIILIINPRFLGINLGATVDNLPSTFLLISCLSVAVLNVLINLYLKKAIRFISPTNNSFATATFGVIIYSIIGQIQGGVSINLQDFIITQILSFYILVSHYPFVAAIGLSEKPSILIILNSSQVLMTYVINAIINPFRPNVANIIGVILFFCAIVFIGLRDVKTKDDMEITHSASVGLGGFSQMRERNLDDKNLEERNYASELDRIDSLGPNYKNSTEDAYKSQS